MLCILFILSVIFNVVYKRVQAVRIEVFATPIFGNLEGRKEKLQFFRLVGFLLVCQDGFYDGGSRG